ncbi:MAG: glycosyltransferase [Desulfovibrionaceae bacterium]
MPQRPPRIVFVKTGNGPAEARALGPGPDPARGGPAQYTAGFLHLTGSAETLILSLGREADAMAREAGTLAREADAMARPGLLAECLPYLGVGRLARLRLLARIAGKIRAHRPDAVLCATSGPVLWTSALAARRAGAPLIFSAHNALSTGYEAGAARLRVGLDARVIRGCDAAICNGSFLHGQLLEAGVPEDRLFPFTAAFDPPAAPDPKLLAAHGAPQGPFVLYAGRLVREKGVFDLLEQMLPLLAEQPGLHLVFAGEGPALPELRRRAAEPGALGRVHPLGRVPHEAVAALMAASLFTAAPTRGIFPEGRPKSVVESLINGRPVVAPSEGPFLQDLAHEENALLFPANDAAALGRALRELLERPELLERLTEGARRSGEGLRTPQTPFHVALDRALRRVGRPLMAEAPGETLQPAPWSTP